MVQSGQELEQESEQVQNPELFKQRRINFNQLNKLGRSRSEVRFLGVLLVNWESFEIKKHLYFCSMNMNAFIGKGFEGKQQKILNQGKYNLD